MKLDYIPRTAATDGKSNTLYIDWADTEEYYNPDMEKYNLGRQEFWTPENKAKYLEIAKRNGDEIGAYEGGTPPGLYFGDQIALADNFTSMHITSDADWDEEHPAGEPLDNLDSLLPALEVLTSAWGFGWSPTRITVSTAGVASRLERFLEATQVHLAVSLHNPFPHERAEIMPIEKAWPIREVVEILRRYDFTHQRRVSFEYIVMSGLNDSPRHIRELCRLLDGIKCRINLIRFHKIPGSPYFSPDDRAMIAFRDALTAKGIHTTIRTSRGEDIQAACGLLSTAQNEAAQF